MRAMMKSGRIISGRIAETFIKKGLAVEAPEEVIKKKRGNPQNLKNHKLKKETGS